MSGDLLLLIGLFIVMAILIGVNMGGAVAPHQEANREAEAAAEAERKRQEWMEKYGRVD